MGNVAYALMVRDVREDPGGIRPRLDDALVGKIAAPSQPEMDDMQQWGQKEVDMDTLRETWGANPQAAQGKQALDSLLRSTSPPGVK